MIAVAGPATVTIYWFLCYVYMISVSFFHVIIDMNRSLVMMLTFGCLFQLSEFESGIMLNLNLIVE